MPIDLPPIEYHFNENHLDKNVSAKTLLFPLFLLTDTAINSIEADSFLMKNITDRIKKIIVDKLGVDEAEVNTEAAFTNDLGADSLDTVELVMEFEKEFNISIADEDAEKIITVGDAIVYIQQKIKAVQ